MKKFFVTNLFFLLTLNILIKSFWILGIDRSVQNSLPSGDYGMYYALLNFTYLFNIILDAGITSFNNRTIAQNTVLLRKYFSKIVPLKIVLAGVYAVILFIVALISGYEGRYIKILSWLCVFQVLTTAITYLRSNISALLLFKTDSVLSVLDKSLTIIFCSILLFTPVLHGNFTVEHFVYVQVLSLFITFLTALSVCLHKTGFIRLSWDGKYMLAVLKYGFPFALLTLLMSFYNRMDTVMLERMLDNGREQAEIYASGFRLVDSVNMVAYLFSVILLPLFAKMIKDRQDVRDIIKISFHILLLLTTGFVTCACLYAQDLMSLMYTKHVEESVPVFRILSFCFIPVSMTYIFGTLLTAGGYLKKLNVVAACGMILNIVINIILIPRLSALGSCIAALTAQTVTASIQAIIALHIFDVKFSWAYVLKILLFLFSVALAGLVVKQLCIEWWYKAILSLMIFVLFAFVCKIFNINELKAFCLSAIKSKKDN